MHSSPKWAGPAPAASKSNGTDGAFTSRGAHDRRSLSRLDAFWFWGKIPSETEICSQLTDFKANGFFRIYIQARLSLPLELYLSQAWLKAYRTAVDVMADLGLKAGLYDDYAWTSGQAGGRTVAGADHLRETHVFWVAGNAHELKIESITATLGAALGPAVRNWIHDGGTPLFSDWSLKAAVLSLDDGTKADVTEDVELISSDSAGAVFRITYLPPRTTWTVFASARVCNSRIINYLVPEAGERFVSQGLEPYADNLGSHMGTTVDCLFFDQPAPALYDWPGRYGNLGNSLPWSNGFEQKLAAKGPLADQLSALLEGDQCGARRSDLYRALTEQMQQAFFGPLQQFCRKNCLKLTGHEILPHVASFDLNGGFTSIDPRVSLAADFFGTDLWRDETSVDANNLGAQLSPLLGDSIARASGRKGCWTELYLTAGRTPRRAAGRWELTPVELRRQLVRLHMLGASRVILHALFADSGDATEEVLENARFDFPPGYNLQPWWPAIKDMAAEISELSDRLENLSPPPQVALVYPYETALREGPRHDHARAFGAWCTALLAYGHRPLICDENGLETLLAEGSLYGSEIAAIALPGEIVFHDETLANRLEHHGLPVHTALPASIPSLFGDNMPILEPVSGVRHLLAGKDEAGNWQLVLFNEEEATKAVEIRSLNGLACPKECTVNSRTFKVQLGPNELRHVSLAPAWTGKEDELALATNSPFIGDLHLVLKNGWTLTTDGDAAPVAVDKGWQEQGRADWSGTGIYECRFELEHNETLILHLPQVACMAEVFLDGRSVGRGLHAPYVFGLGTLSKGGHHLRIDVSNTMANAYYVGTEFAGDLWPDVSGLTAPPALYKATTHL